MDAGRCGSYRSCFGEIWRTRVWILLVSRVVLMAGFFCMAPLLQTELTDYFLHKHTTKDMECTGDHHGPPPGVGPPPGIPFNATAAAGPPHEERHGPPHECIQAHTDVLLWTTSRTLISAFTVSLFLNAAVGSWSDMYGRKPFLIYSTLASTLNFLVVYLYLTIGFELYWYFIVHLVAAPFSSSSIILAYIADVIQEQNRLLTFGLNTLVFSIGVIIGTGLTLSGLVSNLQIASVVGGALCLVSTLLIIFFLPESLTPELQHQARAIAAEKRNSSNRRRSLGFLWTSFSESMKILWRTPMFRRLTIIMFIVALVSEEYIEFKTQYLQEVIGFGTSEQTIMMMIMGVSGLLINSVGIWIVKPVLNLTDKQLLTFGTLMVALAFVLLAAVTAAWMAYLSTALVSFWMLLSIAISSMKSANVAPEEQGAVQGALTAISGIGFGLGPVVFFILYVAFRHGAVYIPGAPFYFAFFLVMVSVIISLTIKPPMTRNTSEVSLSKLEGGSQEPLIPAS